MAALTVLRVLIVVEVVCEVLGVYGDFLLQSTLPPEVQAFLAEQSQPPFEGAETLVLVFLVALVIGGIVALVGLWFTKRWARMLYTALVAVSFVATLLAGLTFNSAFSATMYAISWTASGAILGIAWFSDLKERFRAPA